MWEVYESRRAHKNIERLPRLILEKYEFWKNIIVNSGPIGLREIPGFKDHALSGQWFGYRSSYLSYQYRVIYSINKQEVVVEVFDVNPHDYRYRR